MTVVTGSGCLRVLEDLISLKTRYPDRVQLILGNRDINKMRISSSTHPAVLSGFPKTYWVKPTEEELRQSGYKLNDPEAKLKWVRFRILLFVWLFVRFQNRTFLATVANRPVSLSVTTSF